MATITTTRSVVDVELPEDEPPIPASSIDADALELTSLKVDADKFRSAAIEHLTAILRDGSDIEVVLLGDKMISITTEPSRSAYEYYRYPVATFTGRRGYIEYRHYGDKKRLGPIVAYSDEHKTLAVFWSTSSTAPQAIFTVA